MISDTDAGAAEESKKEAERKRGESLWKF